MFIDYTSPLVGTRTFTVKLDDTPEEGDYRISYTPSSGELYIHLAANDGTDLGLMGFGMDAIAYNGLYYSLVDQKGVVYLHVSGNQDPPFIGAVKLSKNGVVYDSDSGYVELAVSAADDCDHVLVGDGGQVHAVTVGDGGSVDAYGIVYGATIENGGRLTLKEGGRALSNVITVNAGGNVTIEGGKVDLGAAFHLAGGTITVNGVLQGWEDDSGDEWGETRHWFVYDLDKLNAAPSDVMISDYTMLQCNPEFTANMSANQKNVSYKLLGNASGFDSYVSLNVEGHDYQEYLRLGQECSIGDSYYSLAIVDNILTLNVSATRPVHAPAVWADIEEPTTGSVTVTASFDETAKTKEYSLDGVTWKTYKKAVKVTENGTIYFRGKDSKGNTSPVVSYEVTNIQKASPEQEKPSVPDLGDNDTPVLPDGTLNPETTVEDNPMEQGGSTDIIMDAAGSVEQDGYNNFVGEKDKVDNAKITLEKAAKLSFTVKADSKVKLTFYQLVENAKKPGTYTKKVLKTVSVSKAKGDEKSTASVLVEGGSDKNYYVSVENKNSKSKGAYYNVSLTTEGKNACEFFDDGDTGENNGPLLVTVKKVKIPDMVQIAKFQTVEITESGTKKPVVFDTNEITAAGAPVIDDGWKNFVGFGDDNDYVKLSATQPVKLNFTITATNNVKLVVYSISKKGSKWSQTAKTLTVSLKRSEKNGSGYATRSLEVSLDRLGINAAADDPTGYYISVQSTNAKTGGKAWYNVSVDSTVFASDYGTNKVLFTDKKSKDLNKDIGRITAAAGEKNAINMEVGVEEKGTVEVSKTVEDTGKTYTSFVGYGDEYDYAEIVFNETEIGTCTFSVETWGTAKASSKFTIYKLTRKSEKDKWTKKSLGTITVKNTPVDPTDKYASGSGSKENVIIDVTTGDNVKYYVSMQSVDAKKGKEVYYNAFVTIPSTSEASSLSMPEAELASSNLFGTQDAMSFGGYVTTDASLATSLDIASERVFEESGKGILA